MKKKTKKKLTLVIDLAIWFGLFLVGLYFVINYIASVYIFDDEGMYLYGLSFCVYVMSIFLIVIVWAMVSMALKDYKEKEDEKRKTNEKR